MTRFSSKRQISCGWRTALSALCAASGLLFGAGAPCAEPAFDLVHGDIPQTFSAPTAERDFERIEAMVSMRDGVKLFTIIVRPMSVGGPQPIILTRTPYSATKRADGNSQSVAMVLRLADESLTREGYIRVYQDVRGKHRSDGAYITTLPPVGALNTDAVDHGTDTWDTIEWLIRNVPNNNGRVGITGVSYDGFLTLMALLKPHPALRAAVPVDPMVDAWMGDDWYHQGALRQTYALDYFYWQTGTKDSSGAVPYGAYDMYSAFLKAGSAAAAGRRWGADALPAWNRVIDHSSYDQFWREQAVHRLLAQARPAVPTLIVHSLFDQEDIYGSSWTYKALSAVNPSTSLVIGPWHHGQYGREGSSLGKMRWGSDTSLYFREKRLLRFWDTHLKGDDRDGSQAIDPVLAFRTGENEWYEYGSWPPAGVKPARLYLREGGALSFEAPKATRNAPSFTQYLSDPAKPVPYRTGPIRPIWAADSTWREWLVDDQRDFATRPDVVTFVSEPFGDELTIAGEVAATLFASTTGSDADWVVKLIDVFPDEVMSQPELGGYQLMIAGDILRGRYRQSFESPQPIAAGSVLPYRIALPDVHHTVKRGHRLMVQIQSSWFPLYDRNPQTFVANIAKAAPGDYTAATQRVYHSGTAASFVELPLLPRTALAH